MSTQSDLVNLLTQSKSLLELAICEIETLLKETVSIPENETVLSKSSSSLERLRVEIHRRLIRVKPAVSNLIHDCVLQNLYKENPELRGK